MIYTFFHSSEWMVFEHTGIHDSQDINKNRWRQKLGTARVKSMLSV